MDFSINWDFLIKFSLLSFIPFITARKDLTFNKLNTRSFKLANLFGLILALSIFSSYHDFRPYQLGSWGIFNLPSWIFVFTLLIIFTLFFVITTFLLDETKEDEFKNLQFKLEKIKKEEDKKGDVKIIEKEINRYKIYYFITLIFYVLFFCVLALFFVKTSIFKDYISIKGKITDSKNKPIANAKITFFTADNSGVLEVKSNKFGSYELFISDSTSKKLTSLSVETNSFKLFTKEVSGEASLRYTIIELQSIKN